MILGPNQVLQIVLGMAATTNQPTWVLQSGSTMTYGSTTDTTPATIISGSNLSVPVDELWIYNADTAAAKITLSVLDLAAGTSTNLFTQNLSPSVSLFFGSKTLVVFGSTLIP